MPWTWTPWVNKEGRRERINPKTGIREVEVHSSSGIDNPFEAALGILYVVLFFCLAFMLIKFVFDTNERYFSASATSRDDRTFERALAVAREQDATYLLDLYLREFPNGEHVAEAQTAIERVHAEQRRAEPQDEVPIARRDDAAWETQRILSDPQRRQERYDAQRERLYDDADRTRRERRYDRRYTGDFGREEYREQDDAPYEGAYEATRDR